MKVLTVTLLGALVCALLSAAMFVAFALLDGTPLQEALAFALIVGFFGAVLGAVVGLLVGLARLGMLGGALAGLLVAGTLVVAYVLSFGRPGEYAYFLSESRILLLLMALPLVLTGVLAARLGNSPARPV